MTETSLKKKIAIFGGATLFVTLIIIAVIALESYLVMTIWNNVITKKFPDANIQELSFWDALGLMVLINILFPNKVVYANKFNTSLLN